MYGDDATRLRHMLDATREALGFVSGRGRSDLDGNHMLALALIRELEIIGEAGGHTSCECRAQNPQIPWASIVAMRNWLIHAYYTVNLNLVWSTVVNDLPVLLAELEKIVSKSD